MKEQYRKKAIGLTFLWIISFLFAFILSFMSHIKVLPIEADIVEVVSAIGAYLFTGLYFFPLLFQINKYAQLAKMEKLFQLTRYGCVLFKGTLFLFPIAFIVMCITA